MSSGYNNSSQNKATPVIPREVRQLLQGRCDSPTLNLQKFPTTVGTRAKPEELREFCKLCENTKQQISGSLLLPEIPGAISFCGKTKARLLVNHTGGIQESNLALHRFFGCPIIPGSALKGIARSAARFDDDKERFARVFGGMEKGDHDQAGAVAFLMAIPENQDWHLVTDILTPHDKQDRKNPVPIVFLTVEKGAFFRFTVAPTARTKDGDLEFAVKYLKHALADYGVGAKTAAGYGWFEMTGDK